MKKRDGFDYWCKVLGLPQVSREVSDAAHYLEKRGYRFLVDFGVDNAVEKVMDEPGCDWVN